MIDAKKALELLIQAAENAAIAWYAANPEYDINERDEEERPLDEEGYPNWDAIVEVLYETTEWHIAEYTGKLEDHYGGEGKGDDYYYVWSFTTNDGTQYFKVDGYYSSWSGVSWEDAELVEVEPVEVVKREWR